MMDYVFRMSRKNYVKVIMYILMKDFKVLCLLACKTFICLNGKTCMIENGTEVCRCLFNCSSEKNQVDQIDE